MKITQIFPALLNKYKPQANKINTHANKFGPGRKPPESLNIFPPTNNHDGRKESGRYGRFLQRYFDSKLKVKK